MSITATAVAGAVSDWAGVVDFPAEIVIGLGVLLGIVTLGIGMFRTRRAARGRR